MLTACNGDFNFSKGTKKDLVTGLSTSWSGLSVDDAYLMDTIKKEKISDNKVTMQQKIAITLTGVGNFKEIDGKVKPGMDILVTDEQGNAVIEAKDLFKESYTKEQTQTLEATLTIGDPMQSGKKYQMKARIYDKNGEGTIDSGIDLEVQ